MNYVYSLYSKKIDLKQLFDEFKEEYENTKEKLRHCNSKKEVYWIFSLYFKFFLTKIIENTASDPSVISIFNEVFDFIHNGLISEKVI